MDRDEMRNGDRDSAVRILPADGSEADRRGESLDRQPDRRWIIPAAALTALLALVVLTRPSGDVAAPTSTTEPPALSAVSTELIDISSAAGSEPVTEEWESVEFATAASVEGVIRMGTSLVAYGSTSDGAAAWVSGNGLTWRDVSRFEAPETPKSSIDRAATWDGGLIALGDVNDGIGVWTATSVANWQYQGAIPQMEAGSLIGIGATDHLVALTGTTRGQEAWTSPDGRDWANRGEIETLRDVLVLSVAAHDGWFYAGGQRNCQEPPCPATIYRSQDGLTWRPAAGTAPGSLSEGEGAVVDITATANGLLAVGHADDQIAIWHSRAGSTWDRIAVADSALRGTSVDVQLNTISPEDGEATLTIADGQHRVTRSSEIRTDVGVVRVGAVEDDYVDIEWPDGSRYRAEPGSTETASLAAFAHSVAADGSRIVMAGHVSLHDGSAPAVWTSVDGGASWQMRTTPNWTEGRLTSTAVAGRDITVVGETGGATLAWHSRWDTSLQEAAGLELTEAYFSAARSGNAAVLLDLLPAEYGTFQLPALGSVDLEWWGENRDQLSADSVAATLDYLSALDTEFTVEDCRARTVFRETESVRVACEFSVESDLLAAYSDAENRGTVETIVEDGELQRVHLSAAPSARMWQTLVDGTYDSDAADRATLVSVTEGVTRFDPTYTGTAAAAHLRLVADFVSGLLRPGESRVVETSLGTMEWTWLEELPLPVFAMPWIAPFDGGFVATGYGSRDGWTEETSLWTSTDGLGWEPMPVPDARTSLWDLQPFRDGLIGQAWRDDGWQQQSPTLVYFDGSSWTDIDLPEPPEDHFLDILNLAVSGESLMVVTQYWTEAGYAPLDRRAWLLGTDDVLYPAMLPPGLAETEEPTGLAGYDDGFLLASAEFGAAREMTVWHSSDGQVWSEIAATTNLDDAAYVWNLQRHRDKFFVVGEGAETVCSTTEDGSDVCGHLVGLWSSPDGADWARVFTTSGETVSSFEVGSGPLGLVAVGMESWEMSLQRPRPVYLSADGSEWERAGALNLFNPDVEWWWSQRPSVGEDVVLIAGSSYDPADGIDSDIPFLIVGRVIDE